MISKHRNKIIGYGLASLFLILYLTSAFMVIDESSADRQEYDDFKKASVAACFANPLVAEYLEQNGPGIIGVHYYGAEHRPRNRFCSVATGDGNTKWLDFIPE